MKEETIFENKFLITIGAFLITSVFILIEYFSGGVATHHLLARKDLPGLSNWWGLILVPLLAWFVSVLIKQRRLQSNESKQSIKEFERTVLLRFLSALFFGIFLSVLWELKIDKVLPFLILLPILIAFFKPVHFPEFILGFVIGMMYTFGGILPVIVGIVLSIICFLVYKVIQLLKTLIKDKSQN